MNRQFLLLLAALAIAAVAPARATQEIIGVTTTSSTGAPVSAEGYTFENKVSQISTFSTSTASYGVSTVADNVFVRRNGTNPNNSSVWYISSGTGTNLSGVHESLYGPMLLGNNLFSGSDNSFANTAPSNALHTVGNIERIDFTWNSAITVSNSLAFAIFERGAAAVHDSFAMAAVLSVDANGNPTSFGSLLKVAGGWGATNPVADADYRLFRYNNGDDISASTLSTEVQRQGIGGLLITAADLGLVSGTLVYGYALMSADVTATNSSQLLDWTNALYFPTETDATTGEGGIDLASLNGVAFAVVPEPAALAPLAIFAGVFGFANYRCARRSR
jgi:hypothetical protein